MKRRRGLLLAAGIVLMLCVACGVWLHTQRQQYDRNRSLMDTVVNGDIQSALTLVNEGADPNTRYEPMAAPTLKLLLDHLLHHSAPTVNNSPTALMIACGLIYYPPKGALFLPLHPEEKAPLAQAMLLHGADVHARDSSIVRR